MMRFDLTCNITLRAQPRSHLILHVLPAQTEQQRLLHEVIWVEGCERWTISPRPQDARVLNLLACENEVHIAFAASLVVAPVWRHAAALWDAHGNGFTGARAAKRSSGPWSAERIVSALGPKLCSPPAAFAALPDLFEWIHQCMGANGRAHDLCDPAMRTSSAAAGTVCATQTAACGGPVQAENRTLEQLKFAIAVFRALGVPARIVTGFAPEFAQLSRDDARAFNLELYRDGRWWLFEPDGRVPAFGFVRTGIGYALSELLLLQGTAQVLTMHADVDPPPAWGLPLRTSSRLFLSLDAQRPAGADSQLTRQVEANPSV